MKRSITTSIYLFIYLYVCLFIYSFTYFSIGFQIYSFQKVLQMFPVSTADESKVIIIRKLKTYKPCQGLCTHLNMLFKNHFVSLLGQKRVGPQLFFVISFQLLMFMMDIQSDPKGLSIGGLVVINKSMSLTVKSFFYAKC